MSQILDRRSASEDLVEESEDLVEENATNHMATESSVVFLIVRSGSPGRAYALSLSPGALHEPVTG